LEDSALTSEAVGRGDLGLRGSILGFLVFRGIICFSLFGVNKVGIKNKMDIGLRNRS